MIEISLSFEGNEADSSELDLYDAAHAMMGFQRSLALTTHLLLNGKVITKAPFLKNAQIFSTPPEEGSWKMTAIIATSIYSLSTAPRDTPLGNLVHSAYDYVISESLGFHVDYEKTLQAQYDQLERDPNNKLPIIEQSQLDSVIEKCEFSIKEMHRPIIKSGTAESATILFGSGTDEEPLENPLDRTTFIYMQYTDQDEKPSKIGGKVSSYNINTFKGRIFVPEERRPIAFELAHSARSPAGVAKIASSLGVNATDRFNDDAIVTLNAFKNFSRSGRLKSLYVVEVEQNDQG